MRISNPKWRGFLQHLGPYIIVNTMLAIINVLTTPTLEAFFPWFLFPALAWGIGLGIHFWNTVLSTIEGITRQWRGFLQHLGPYVMVIGFLAAINLLTSLNGSFFPWFLFPATAWGVGLFIHFWNILFSGGNKDKVGKKDVEYRQEARKHRESEHQQIRPSMANNHLVNKTIQAHLDKAQAYQEQIDSIIQTTSNEMANARLKDLARQVDEWVQAIEGLARRVDKFQQNTLIRHDLEDVPQYIEELETRLVNETHADTRAELERTLTNRKNQLASLERLQNMMKRAEIQIESTLSALGTIYSQILTGQSTNHVADYGRLSTEVDEEVRGLQDHLEALEEVKLGRG